MSNRTQPNRNLNILSYPKLLSLKEPSGTQGQNDYIWSLAPFPEDPRLLATSDSDGYITIWDLNQCQDINPSRKLNEHEPIEQKCEPHDHWRASEKSVRSIAGLDIVNSNRSRQLVSAGDDGRLVVWPLTVDNKLDRQKTSAKEQGIYTGQEIYKSDNKLNSIDMRKNNQTGEIMIVSGGDDFKVKLHRLPSP